MRQKTLRRLAFVALVSPAIIVAQSSIIIPPPLTQSFTPAALAPGTPAGSYILSDFDTINYGNLSVNFRFPLVKIGGRGSVSAVMMPDFTTYSQWAVYPTPVMNCGQEGCTVSSWHYNISNNNAWSSAIPSIYGVPRIMVREGGYPCGQGGGLIQNIAGSTLSRVTFIGPDGTEMALIDQRSGGEPQPYALGQGGYYDRGAVWVTRDGTSAVFTTSGGDIQDTVATASNCSEAPAGISGTLVMRDGTQYTFVNGYARSITDRNGNTITYTFSDAGYLTGIIDPVGRQYGVTQGLLDSASGRRYDLLTYPGANGAVRPIKIFFDILSNVLRSDQSIQTDKALWPGVLSVDQIPSPIGGTYISQILLPDNSSYSFRYDSYGNVARIQLPAGGAVEYDWAGQVTAGSVPGPPLPNSYFLRCILTTRREYLSSVAGTPASRVTTYSNPGLVTVSDYDGTGSVLQAKTIHNVVAGAWPPPSEATAYDDPTVGQEPSTRSYDRDGSTLLREIDRTYQERSCAGDPTCWWINNGDNYGRPPHDPLLMKENTTEEGLVKQTQHGYDNFNNENDTTASDWGMGVPGPVLREISTTYNTNSSYTNANILNLPIEVQIFDGFGTKWGDTTYGYDQSTASSEANPVIQNFTPTAPRGNRTSITECVNLSTCNAAITTYTYDVAGNVLSITDANSHTANLSYRDNYSDGTPRNTYAHLTQLTYPPANASSAPEIASWQYDYGTGKTTMATDVNGVNTGYSFASDPLDRLTQIIRAAGISGVQTQTNVVYSLAGSFPLSVDVYNDQTSFADQVLHSRTLYDGFGRVIENDTYTDSSGDFVKTLKTYDPMGRLSTTSTPAAPNGPFSQSWLTTYYPYDGLGRVAQVTTQADGAYTSTSYFANQTTVTDQAGIQRTTWTDGLGRLVQVEESPASDQFFTTYGYDALDDLVCANQGSVGSLTANPQIYSCQNGLAHSRSFSYDGVKRLLSSTNPEAGTINYSYDNVGNLLTKTDGRFETCFGTLSGSGCNSGYDGMNRPTVKSFSDPNTPQVNYLYDVGPSGGPVPYAIGRLTQLGSSASTTNYNAYDPMGRVTSSTQTTAGVAYQFPAYSYNLAGSLVSETYPSGRTISTGYDGANRAAWLQGSIGGNVTPYIGNNTGPDNWIQYWPNGEPWAFFRGNNLWHAASLNGRLQVVESYESINNEDSPTNMLFMSCPGWGFSNNANWGTYNDCPLLTGTNDNGNLQAYDEYIGGPGSSAKTHFQQSFTYDHENRLSSASDSGGWSRNFGYDQWGNIFVTGNNGVPLNPNTASSASQYNANNQRVDQTYDASGNLQGLLSAPNLTLTYDAENRQLSAGSYSYTYDAAGHRVSKTGGGSTTVYVYDAGGLLAAEYSDAPNASPCTTCYLSYDYLGTTRLVTDQNANIVSRHDFLPFGEEIPSNTASRDNTWGSGNDSIAQKFTGKERDAETGLDYFGARYFGSALGRFTSPDPLLIASLEGDALHSHLANPQSLNKYGYVFGNPLRLVDPDGRDPLDSTLLNHLLNFNAWAMPIAEKQASSMERDHAQGNPQIIDKRSSDLLNRENIQGTGFDPDLATIRMGASNELRQHIVEQMGNDLLSKVTAWANLSSTTVDDLRRVYGALLLAKEDRTVEKVKGSGEKVGDYADKVPVIGGTLSKVGKAVAFGAELSEGYQKYVDERAQDEVKKACEKKTGNAGCN